MSGMQGETGQMRWEMLEMGITKSPGLMRHGIAAGVGAWKKTR